MAGLSGVANSELSLALQDAPIAYLAGVGLKAGVRALVSAATNGGVAEVTEGAGQLATGVGAPRGAAVVDQVIARSGGSIKAAIGEINKAGLSQSEAVDVITRVTKASGRNFGGVVEVDGARVIPGVMPGRGPIVHVAADGVATFGTADVAFSIDAAGNVVTTVTNIVLP